MWPLVTSTFTEKECEEIIKPILLVGLSRSNIVRTLSRAVVHGPTEYGGLALPNLYTEQGIYKIDRLCKFGANYKFIAGFLLRDSFEHVTLELGLPGNPLDQEYQQWHHLVTDCWIKSGWKFLKENNIAITPTTPQLTTIRQCDSMLMQRFH